MNKKVSLISFSIVSFVLITFSLIINGAIPFVGAPTLQQALTTTAGFAQSLLNSGSFYAENFGHPTPMPRSFGLSGVLPTSLFLLFGISAIDSYTLMVTGYLVLAFFGGYFFAKRIGVTTYSALFLSCLWLVQPVVIGHAGYSMLSLGFALLPLYLYSTLNVYWRQPCGGNSWSHFFVFFLTCILSVFMDGYTFVMFGSASLFLAIYFLFILPDWKKSILTLIFFVLSLGFSYFLYKFYIGNLDLSPAPIDFFRGWGVDLSFLVVPTGNNWLLNLLGLSVSRSGAEWFGDSSTWKSTFALPLIISGGIGLYLSRKSNKLSFAIFIITLLSFYMSMGPSVKVFSVKPEQSSTELRIGPMMKAEHAVMPTGNAVFYENIPGLKSMRATYRWHGLFLFGLWVGTAFLIVYLDKNNNRKSVKLCIILLFVSTIPSPIKTFNSAIGYRERASSLDSSLLANIRKDIEKDELVAFLPYGNDLTVNYLSSFSGFKTLNVGGDKNLALAKSQWPYVMTLANKYATDNQVVDAARSLLLTSAVDVIVLPYINLLWSTHRWPDPLENETRSKRVAALLNEDGFFAIKNEKYYTTIRAKANLDNNQVDKFLLQLCLPPSCIKWSMQDRVPPSQVGISVDGYIRTSGDKGFLIFGPYQPLDSGKYRLKVFGEYSSWNGWLDVVSSLGKKLHFKSNMLNNEDGLLLDEELFIDAFANDVEIRIFVHEGDKIAISGYELLPI